MGRILLRLVVVAVMLAMLLATAMPAFAQGQNETAPNCEEGNDTAYDQPPEEEGGLFHRDVNATDALDQNYYGFDKNPNAAFCLR